MASFEMKNGKRVLKSRTDVPPIARDTTRPARRAAPEQSPAGSPADQPAARKEQK